MDYNSHIRVSAHLLESGNYLFILKDGESNTVYERQIPLIKDLRQRTRLGLVECKSIVDNAIQREKYRNRIARQRLDSNDSIFGPL